MWCLVAFFVPLAAMVVMEEDKPPVPPRIIVTKSLRYQLAKLEGSKPSIVDECCICYKTKVEAYPFVSCKHTPLCVSCLKTSICDFNMTQCPLCRRKIKLVDS